MSLLTKILEKLGLKKDTSGAAGSASSKPSGTPPPGYGAPKGAAGHAGVGGATPMSEVDVMKKLEEMGKGSPGLDWKVSIVDLLKLLGIDSSLEDRKELAKELGCPPDLMGDSAKMNVWLHKAVLREIAKNGGNVPASMLD